MSYSDRPAESLLQLARSRTPSDREQLLNALVHLGSRVDEHPSPEGRLLLGEIFLSLVTVAEHGLRSRLAARLASEAWPPHELIVLLARDEIEIARPIIASSPVLRDHDLIRLLVEATLDHQIEVARRPQLPQGVVSAVLDQAAPDVLTALAGNETAQMPPLGMARLVRLSQSIAALRTPLTRHPELTSELAALLYAWVGETLRRALASRFQIKSPDFDRAIAQTLQDLKGGTSGPSGLETLSDDRAEMEKRVVQKLHAAGQLRAGLLIRALHEKRLTLFKAAMSALADYSPEQVLAAVDADGPDLLALACERAGVDRSAFSTVLSLVRELNHGRPGV